MNDSDLTTLGTVRVLLIGGGGHSSDLLGIIESDNRLANGQWQVTGIYDDNANHSRFEGRDVAIYPNVESLIDSIDIATTRFISAIGDPRVRLRVAASAENLGLHAAPPLIHPGVVNISTGVTIGDGSVVHAGASVNVKAIIKCHCVVSHGALVAHDTIMEDGATILPGASTAGDTKIGRGAQIGSGAIVLEGLEIGDFARVGAGAVVTKDVPAGKTVVGIPARELSN